MILLSVYCHDDKVFAFMYFVLLEPTVIGNGITSKILWYAKKKIYFYLSWISQNTNINFHALAISILHERG